ncbi:MAG: GNAT family N-acetyltransferase [Oscillospiraceae bacterium]|jgi:RimJ/RimL family protein N-acetyltransferase|nr:GNAT family N-acetyltransferase [Oscillospiraceae bacterium]
MESIFETYYWQNDSVRLRSVMPSDSEYNYTLSFDVLGIAFVAAEMPLPPVRRLINDDEIQHNNASPGFIIETLSGDYIGGIHFNYINERHGTFSIGMVILNEQRGKGFGKAAMSILFEYAFNERRLHKFEGFCLDENIASAKMMESLGCILEGTSREAVFYNGKYHSRLLYGLLENEYRQRTK